MLQGSHVTYGSKPAAANTTGLITARKRCSARMILLRPYYGAGGNGGQRHWQPKRQHQSLAAMSFPQPTSNNVGDSPGNANGSVACSSNADTTPAKLTASFPDPASKTGDLSLEPFKALVTGRSFMCTMCGKCCSGDGEIWVSPSEGARIARHLNMSLQRFLDTHTKQYSKYKGWRMLKTAEGSSSCVFLGADNKCTIHTVRPSQCSTYPWWPELTLDSEWNWEKANICEGFDHPEAGPLDVEEAAKQLREGNKMTQMRLLASEVRITPKVAEWADSVLLWDDEIGGAEQGKTRKGEAQVYGRPNGVNGSGGGRSSSGGGGGGGGSKVKGNGPSSKAGGEHTGATPKNEPRKGK